MLAPDTELCEHGIALSWLQCFKTSATIFAWCYTSLGSGLGSLQDASCRHSVLDITLLCSFKKKVEGSHETLWQEEEIVSFLGATEHSGVGRGAFLDCTVGLAKEGGDSQQGTESLQWKKRLLRGTENKLTDMSLWWQKETSYGPESVANQPFSWLKSRMQSRTGPEKTLWTRGGFFISNFLFLLCSI